MRDKELTVISFLVNVYIIEDGQYLGMITPIMGDKDVTWSTHSEKIGKDYAQQIGELIEEHDM